MYNQKSFGACDRQITALSSYARAARLSIGTAAAGIGNLFTRKMATTANNLCPWPNSQDDYELRDVIGKCFIKYLITKDYDTFYCYSKVQINLL